MPRQESTKKDENVEYIVRGTSPVFSVMSVVTFVLIVAALVLQYLELTQIYNQPPGIFF